MKKVIALVMVCAMSMALFGCGKKDTNKGGGETTKAAAQATEKAGGNAGGDATLGAA